jgi:peptidoglycan/xylan/chitin deacetylase (PgdA/CDA1 family)
MGQSVGFRATETARGCGWRTGESDAASTAATEVAVTIDVEFTIGGAFTYPGLKEPVGESSVRCITGGEENGLGFVLSCLAQHGMTATFFVEALQTTYFGDLHMGRVIDRIRDAGHDIQLHLHPCWLYFRHRDWMLRLRGERPNDSCAGRSIGAVRHMLELGVRAFERWSLAKPVALRTGSLRIDRTVYAAMAEFGIPISSSIGLAYERASDPALRLENGRHQIDCIVEIPVTSYAALGPRGTQLRLLTPSATSRREAAELSWRARLAAVTPLVLLAHPHEFIKGHRHELSSAVPNRVVKRRFSEFCRLIAEQPDDFRAVTFAERAAHWARGAMVPSTTVKLPLLPGMRRIVANAINDRFSFV